jgi:predicted nucleic-acid-binding protein
MEYLIDSNIFLRFFTNEENKKVLNDCSLLIKGIKVGKLKAATSHLVIAEVVWTLSSVYKTSKENIIKVITTIESLSGLKIKDDFTTGIAHELFKDYSVKYIDALIASNPRINSKMCAVISYDKDFDKLGIKRLEPSEVI